MPSLSLDLGIINLVSLTYYHLATIGRFLLTSSQSALYLTLRLIYNFYYNFYKEMSIRGMKYGQRAIKKTRLEIWENPHPERDYEVNISFPEFTCLCPRSGYPDFATIKINYVPAKKIIELKSLKLFLNSFRDTYISHEESTNKIYSELEKKLKPQFLEVIGDFNPRGNVKTVVRVSSDSKTNTS
jgi:7-cyano-7-deazaguanine reductase